MQKDDCHGATADGCHGTTINKTSITAQPETQTTITALPETQTTITALPETQTTIITALPRTSMKNNRPTCTWENPITKGSS